METGSHYIKDFFTSLDVTTNELLQIITSAEASTINRIPFKGSWTVAQLVEHVTKSNKAISQALEMNGNNALRNPEARVPELKAMFLDFSSKFNSPEFIRPKKDIYEKDRLITELRKSSNELKELRSSSNLSDIISLPAFGEITKLELLHFVLYHTCRHVHQLKNILKQLKETLYINMGNPPG